MVGFQRVSHHKGSDRKVSIHCIRFLYIPQVGKEDYLDRAFLVLVAGEMKHGQEGAHLLIADAFLSNETSVNPLLKEGFYVISSLRMMKFSYIQPSKYLQEIETIRRGTMIRWTLPILTRKLLLTKATNSIRSTILF